MWPLSLALAAPLVVNLGLPKSGTSSLHDFYGCMGVRSSHWKCKGKQSCGECMIPFLEQNEDPYTPCGNYTVFTQIDMENHPHCLFPQITHLPALFEFAPTATYTLPLRPADDWVRSTQHWHCMDRRLIRCAKLHQWYNLSHTNILRNLYTTHTERVIEFARQHRMKLVSWNLTTGPTTLGPSKCWGHSNKRRPRSGRRSCSRFARL